MLDELPTTSAVRAPLSRRGIGLWRCDGCDQDHDAATSWVEIRPSPEPSLQPARVLCGDCAATDGH